MRRQLFNNNNNLAAPPYASDYYLSDLIYNHKTALSGFAILFIYNTREV